MAPARSGQLSRTGPGAAVHTDPVISDEGLVPAVTTPETPDPDPAAAGEVVDENQPYCVYPALVTEAVVDDLALAALPDDDHETVGARLEMVCRSRRRRRAWLQPSWSRQEARTNHHDDV